MGDACKFMRSNFNTYELLDRYIIMDKGGVSEKFLEEITESAKCKNEGVSSTIKVKFKDLKPVSTEGKVPSEKDFKSFAIVKYLKKYGPALVSSFRVPNQMADDAVIKKKYFTVPAGRKKVLRVHNCFKIPFYDEYDDTDVGQKPKNHAMVLIGVRWKDGKLRVLLQNWWKEMQLLEVSASLLEKSGATLSFLSMKITDVDQDKFGAHNTRYGEAINPVCDL